MMPSFHALWRAAAGLAIAVGVVQGAIDTAIVSAPGSTVSIAGWHMQSTSHASSDVVALSRPGADASSWYRVGSHGTIMAGLLENNVYDDTTLFFSKNLENIDTSPFTVPWLYREEFTLIPIPGQHYFIETNGISSKADLYMNGVQLATNKTLKGAYGGRKFDATSYVKSGKNAILIRAYPTNYLADFALGFVDWNPYPPDNGTGVWREVFVSQSGPVSLLKPTVSTDYVGKATSTVTATIKVLVLNNSPGKAQGKLVGNIKEVSGAGKIPLSATYTLGPGENTTVSLNAIIQSPKIWWPKLWGSQPLYTLDLAAYVGSALSDRTEQRTFGIRHVTSSLNAYNATAFTVNGHYFHVRGGGYSPDMFLRFDEDKLQKQFALMLDMGMNTVRLEGKQEQRELYDLADRMGIMILAGWECCDKWEGWIYNNDADGVKWVDEDYDTAGLQMYHEAYMMQGHASMLAFLIGSDYWPDDRASKVYTDTLTELDWDVPIIASAGMLGWPKSLGPSGLKMDGPYDWVPPNYWYGDQLGAAFGFGSELGAGVGTPELSSLKKFLTTADMDDLWTSPNKGLYHMSSNVSQFYDRSIYNNGLFARYGAPTSLPDYLLKAQISDYEATRAEYEAYSVRKNAERPATGLIYWMMNNAWPSLHWNFFDYYLKGAGSYYGAKMGSRPEHVAFVYGSTHGDIWIINHTLEKQGVRTVAIDLMSKEGKTIISRSVNTTTIPHRSQQVTTIPEATSLKEPAFLRLVLCDGKGIVLSRNVYWLAPTVDTLDWDNSTWYYTPVTKYANYTSLPSMKRASISAIQGEATSPAADGRRKSSVILQNTAKIPAFFIRMELHDENGGDISPAFWDDNYVTLWPGEEMVIGIQWMATDAKKGVSVRVSGGNIGQVRDVVLK